MMNTAANANAVAQMHDDHEVSSVAFQSLVFSLAVADVSIGVAVWLRWIWLAVPLVLLTAHFMHGVSIGFHEASHGLLRKRRRLNEFDGVVIGLFSFLPFSLYRAAHQQHHIHLATERDIELWPFVHTNVPRWARCCAALLELTLGLFYSPFLFLRTFVGSKPIVRSRKVRRRIWQELALSAALWSIVLIAVAYFDLWKYFICMYLLPGMLAANLQNWRKYIEHVGLMGSTVNSSTRTIVPRSWLGRFFAHTLLHEPYHGIHHEDASLPHRALPNYTHVLTPKEPDDLVPFMSYRQALPHLMRSLANPRVGAQWRDSARK